MSDSIDIRITSTFDPKGARAAEQALGRVGKAATDAGKAGKGAASGIGAAGDAAGKAARDTAKAEAQALRYAQAQARLASASGDAAGAVRILASALQGVDRSSLAAINAQTQLTRTMTQMSRAASDAGSGFGALPRTFAGITDEVKGMITGMLGVGAALGAAVSAAQSFADAVNFKAELDATTASINIQLNGVRDVGQVWAEAGAYAQRYKLTQQETAAVVQASVGIMRQSSASVEETFGVLQRLTILSPGKTIQDAAFSVRELAAGDVTSIAEQFDISRKRAYEMRDAIASGADVVSVLAAYLDGAGVSMDTLKVRTEGVLGAQRDLAIAQEQMALAQAEWASGPGLAILEQQTTMVRGLTRLLGGGGGLGEAWRNLAANQQIADAYQQAYTDATMRGLPVLEAEKVATEAAAAMTRELTLAQNEGTTGGAFWGEAQQAGAEAADAAASSTEALAQKLIDETDKKLASAKAAQDLAAFQADLASLAGSVAGGLMSNGDAAALLASRYGIAADEAARLLGLQAQIAGMPAFDAARARQLDGQRSQTRDLTGQNDMSGGRYGDTSRYSGGQGVGYNAPGRKGQSDADVLATIEATQRQIVAEEKKAQDERTANAKGGGGARRAAEQSTGAQIQGIAAATAQKLIEIDERAAAARAAAYAKLAADIRTSSADMVAQQEANDLDLIGAEDEATRKRLAAREAAEAQARERAVAAAQEARDIASTGEAQLAQDTYGIRQQQIQQQQALDEAYAAKQAELAGNPEALAAAKQQYDEATQALADATQVRIDLAQAEARERAAALESAKQAAIEDGAAQVAALGRTKGAIGDAQAAVAAYIDALNKIPKDINTNVTVNGGGSGAPAGSGGGGGGSSAKAAGGGTFVTSGRTNFTVGDNPGGVEVVTVTPLSGVGQSSVSGSNVRMAGGGSTVVDDAARQAEETLRGAPGGPPAAPPPSSRRGSSTKRAAEAAAQDERAAKPALADYASAVKDNLGVLSDILQIRTVLQDPATWAPIGDDVLRSAAQDADRVAKQFAALAATYSGPALEGSKEYSDALRGAFGAIDDGLATFDRLRGSELGVPQAALAAFERGAAGVLGVVDRLGRQAGAIPASAVDALRSTSAAVQEQIIGLSAFGALAGGGAASGGGATTNMGGVSINIYQQPGQDARALADLVMREISARTGMRR